MTKSNFIKVILSAFSFLVLVLLFIWACKIESHYEKSFTVINSYSQNGETIVILKDDYGDEFSFCGTGFHKGERLIATMYTSGTVGDPTDDVIENIKRAR